MADPHPASVSGESPAWQRVHWLSPLARTWKTLGLLLAIIGFNGADSVRTAIEVWRGTGIIGRHFLMIMGVIVAITLAVLLYLFVSWRRMGYRLEADALAFRSGILATTHRRVPYDRIQALDISRPLIGRPLGLADLVVESAGGEGSRLVIGLLHEDALNPLRDTINARVARGYDTEASHFDESEVGGVDVPANEGEDAGSPRRYRDRVHARMRADDTFAPGEYRLYTVPTGEYVLSQFLSLSTLIALALAVAIIVAIGVLTAMEAVEGGLVSVILVTAPWAVPLLGITWHRFTQLSRNYHCRIDATTQGLRISRGLFETTSQTLAPGRVHGLRVTQNPLWRWRDWWSIELIVAAYHGGTDKELVVLRMLAPLAGEAQVRQFLHTFLPELGVSGPDDDWVRAALTGTRADGHFCTPAAAARYFSPLQRHRLGYRLLPGGLVTRRGFLTRQASFLSGMHIQSAKISAGPFDRRFAMADVSAHTVGRGISTVDAVHVPLSDALALHAQLAECAHRCADDEPLRDWYERATRAAATAHARDES